MTHTAPPLRRDHAHFKKKETFGGPFFPLIMKCNFFQGESPPLIRSAGRERAGERSPISRGR